jgi:hypothetical protein
MSLQIQIGTQHSLRPTHTEARVHFSEAHGSLKSDNATYNQQFNYNLTTRSQTKPAVVFFKHTFC